MKFYILLTLIMILQILKVTYGSKCNCGLANENKLKFKIINGILTNPHQYPWAVFLKRGFQHFCGGTLINRRYVITAAHCITSKTNLDACMGHRNIKSKLINCYKVEKVVIHPDFTPYDSYDLNDIALLRLNRIVNFSHSISPICLPTNRQADYTGIMGILYGYGVQNYSNKKLYPMSDDLHHTALKILPDTSCKQNKDINYAFEAKTMLCAYKMYTDGCVGDSGSGFIIKKPSGAYELIGLMSWGVECAKVGVPGVYTRITEYLEWIAKESGGIDY